MSSLRHNEGPPTSEAANHSCSFHVSSHMEYQAYTSTDCLRYSICSLCRGSHRTVDHYFRSVGRLPRTYKSGQISDFQFSSGVIENASGRSSLMNSISASFRALLTQPHTFLATRPFRLISTVYFSTYLTANSIDTISSTTTSTSASHTKPSLSKFFATSTVNMSLGLYKDSQFAQMFGTSLVKRSIPTASYALFALRDSMTIFASFNVPPVLAPMLSEEVEKVMGRASLAQIVAPAAVQMFSTPLHLWGLDLYNRPGASFGGRLRQVGKNWVGSTAARMGRIVPAFGFGGVVNAKVRRKLMERVEERT